MKKAMILIMVLAMVFSTVSTVSAASFPNIKNDKSIYRVYNYRSGDCNLSANTYMIMRKAVLLRDSHYSSIKNDTKPGELKGGKGSVRKAACTNSSSPYNYNDVRNEYTYSNGRTYYVKRGSLSGSASKKEKKIKSLLKSHPEGIVVWGPSCSSYGPHAILAARVSAKGNIKYIDSAHNTWTNNSKWRGYNSKMNVGEESLKGTIVYSLNGLTSYWYISKVK